MTTQPEALRCADALMADNYGAAKTQLERRAAAELRRLHEANQELLEALKLADAMLSGANMNATAVEKTVRAAIAKHKGQA